MAGARVSYAMARDGLFFRSTGTLNKKGVPGSAMGPFNNLSDNERWALAWYVLELKAGRK